MPIYSYKCPSCGTKKDVLQKLGAAAPDCVDCKTPTTKELTAPGFEIRGGGVYSPGVKVR